MVDITDGIPIPKEIYQDDRACADFILVLNEKLAKVASIEKALKEAKDIASNVLLERLELTGQKHFAFDFGTFAKTTKTYVSFPTAENGGKDTAAEWLHECVSRGIIDFTDVINIQQARLSTEPILALEQMVNEYNEKHKFDTGFNPIPQSPFNRYTKNTLTTPRKRK